MKNKGFTLVELLGVISVVAVLMLLTFPSIIGNIRNKEGNIDNATKELLFKSAELYIDLNPSLQNKNFCITIKNLIDEGILEETPSNMRNEKYSINDGIKVTYENSSYDMQFVKNLSSQSYCN